MSADRPEDEGFLTVQELESFFSDLSHRPCSGRYRGVAFSCGKVDKGRLWGTCIEVTFPQPLALDLRLETREVNIGRDLEFPSANEELPYRSANLHAQKDHLKRVFSWSAMDSAHALELLQGKPGAILLHIARSHEVVMDDSGLWYGPVQGTPRAEAETLAALLEALDRFAPPRVRTGQCPACGATIKDHPDECPSCGLILAEST